MNPIIQDGYTFTATLEPVGPWAPLTVRYRPALPEDVMEFNYQREQHKGKGQIKVIADFILRHMLGWDNKTPAGEVRPIALEHVRRLAIPYQLQLIDHLLGYGKVEEAADQKNSASASA